jgi:hypothetical protein
MSITLPGGNFQIPAHLDKGAGKMFLPLVRGIVRARLRIMDLFDNPVGCLSSLAKCFAFCSF